MSERKRGKDTMIHALLNRKPSEAETEEALALGLKFAEENDKLRERTPVPGRQRPRPSANLLNEAIALAVERQLGPPQKRIFGVTVSDVSKFLIAAVGAILTAYYGMKTAIEKNTASIEITSHSLVQLEKKTAEKMTILSESYDKQEAKQQEILAAIDEMKTQIDALKPARRRK
jgi:hypothetical protein